MNEDMFLFVKSLSKQIAHAGIGMNMIKGSIFINTFQSLEYIHSLYSLTASLNLFSGKLVQYMNFPGWEANEWEECHFSVDRSRGDSVWCPHAVGMLAASQSAGLN